MILYSFSHNINSSFLFFRRKWRRAKRTTKNFIYESTGSL
eukprot:UN20514